LWKFNIKNPEVTRNTRSYLNLVKAIWKNYVWPMDGEKLKAIPLKSGMK
jgi:hypothetical protein